MKEIIRTLIAFLAGLLAFLWLYFRACWHIVVSGLIAILIYGAVFFLAKPVKRIGNTRWKISKADRNCCKSCPMPMMICR